MKRVSTVMLERVPFGRSHFAAAFKTWPDKEKFIKKILEWNAKGNLTFVNI